MAKMINGALLCATLLLSGCASIINGRTQKVNIQSNVPNARIFINGEDQGTTPNKVRLKRRSHYEVVIRAKGYSPYRETLRSRLSGMLFWNIPFTGAIGGGIDFLTRACWRYEDVNAVLQPGKDDNIPLPPTPQPAALKNAPGSDDGGADSFLDAVLGDN